MSEHPGLDGTDQAAAVDWIRGRLCWEDRLAQLRNLAGVPSGREVEELDAARSERAGQPTVSAG